MKNKDDRPVDSAMLRRRAEEIARQKATRSPEETPRTLHELRAQQIDLEMQNEELRRARAELEAERARYFDLYDLAPVGYCTLSEQGLILEANLTAATLLAVARGALVEQPLSRFILKEDQDLYYMHRRQLFETGDPQAFELRMLRPDAAPFQAHLEATAAQDADGAPLCRVVMSDITERKFHDSERELTKRLIVLVNTPGDFRECISDLTASLHGWSGCKAVGIRLRAGDDYPYYETSGFPPAFVQEENHLCAYDRNGEILRDGDGNPVLECMCGNILSGRFDPAQPFFTSHGSFWSNSTTALLASTTEADRQARTRNRCNGEGYESVALIPLRGGHQVFGLLQFNDHRPNRFTPGLIAHFEEIADSLAIALSRRQAEEALRESEERYRGLFEHMAEGYTYCRMIFENGVPQDFIYLAANSAFETLTGLRNITGKKVSEVLPGMREADPQLFAIYARVSMTGKSEKFEMFVEALKMWFSIYVYSPGEGRFVAVFDVISERKKAEIALAQEAALLAQTEAISHIGSWRMVLETGRFTWSNEMYNIFGLDRTTTFNHDVSKVIALAVHPEDRAKLEELNSAVPRDAFPRPGDFRIVHPDGTVHWIHAQGEQERDETGKVVALAGFVQEITERKHGEEDLEKNRALLQAIIQGTTDAIYVKDLKGRYMMFNSAVERFLGKMFEEVLGKDDNSFFPADEASVVMNGDRKVIAEGHLVTYEEIVTTFPGKTTTFLSTKGPIFDKIGNPIGLFGIARDITERKQAEQALKLSQQRLSLHVEQTPLAVIEFDIEGRVREWNPAAAAMFGYSRETAIGQHWTFIVPAAIHGQLEGVWAAIVGQRGGGRSTNDNITKDGRKINCEWFSTPLVGPGGRTIGVASLIQDITGRKRAEAALLESARLHQIILDCMPCVALLLRPKSREIVAMNEAAAKAGATLGKTCFGSWPRFVRPCSFCLAPEVWATGEERHLEVEAVGVVWEAHWVPVSDDLYMHYAFDITERKRAEEEKGRLEGQLLQAQKMESVGRLAGGVAHDFNNMLGVILGHTEMALEQVDPGQPLHDDLTEIRKAAERSADLTRQLLAFARKQTVAPKVLDLNETVEGMLNMLERLIGENVHLTWQPEADLWPVKVDPSQIDQILANLCVNARDAIADVGKMTIETGNIVFDEAYCASHAGFVTGEHVLLAVSDDGSGMDKETQSHLFEPFFTTKGMGKGTGLGLATVYGIVKQNNGFINVYSEPGQGTTFKIYLPRHVGKAGQARTQGAAGPARPALRGQETILLVEDEPAILKLTTMMLVRQGYTVLAASTPGEATGLAREHAGEIHLLMTDVVMPEMNGRELAKNLLSIYPHLKRLFMSGYTANVIAHRGVLDEGVYFIQKPFSRKDLAAKVREALDGE
jgi:PAS domain S-box-containing protein